MIIYYDKINKVTIVQPMLSLYMQKRQGMKIGTEKTSKEVKDEAVKIAIKKLLPSAKKKTKNTEKKQRGI